MAPPIKLRCPSGAAHSFEEGKTCPHCREIYPAPILHALLDGRERTAKEREKHTFSVGMLVSNCLRQSYYKLTEEQILELEKLWTFSRGTAIHNFITHTLQTEEKEIFVKKEFPQFDVLGFVDAIHDNVIYEFKTTTNIPDAPQTSHMLQAQAYYSLLPEKIRAAIKTIRVIYLSLQTVRTFEVAKRDITPFLEARSVQLLLALRNKTPPEKEVSWLCKYCEFYDKCFESKVNFID